MFLKSQVEKRVTRILQITLIHLQFLLMTINFTSNSFSNLLYNNDDNHFKYLKLYMSNCPTTLGNQ